MKHIMEEMIEEVNQWLSKSTEEDRKSFINCSEQDLIQYHHSLGRKIRNEFGLWENEWEAEIVNGIDVSPDHPDEISFEVIKKVWKMNNE
jgi:hypothetical protein